MQQSGHVGESFEQYIIQGLRAAGLWVTDTPKTGDYGADLLFVYRGVRFAGQCKYYSGAVGLQAVQEVIGALRYYDAHCGVVFTNSTYTQQAINLAASNNVLLIDGRGLEQFVFFPDHIPMLDTFIDSGCLAIRQNRTELWTLDDLVVRYGMGKQKILRDCLGRGLPYYKVGREYRFESSKVRAWEVNSRYIPYGKGIYYLPEYIRYGEELKIRLKLAKRSGNCEEVQEIRRLRWQHGYSYRAGKCVLTIIAFVLVAWLFWKTISLWAMSL